MAHKFFLLAILFLQNLTLHSQTINSPNIILSRGTMIEVLITTNEKGYLSDSKFYFFYPGDLNMSAFDSILNPSYISEELNFEYLKKNQFQIVSTNFFDYTEMQCVLESEKFDSCDDKKKTQVSENIKYLSNIFREQHIGCIEILRTEIKLETENKIKLNYVTGNFVFIKRESIFPQRINGNKCLVFIGRFG